MKTWPCGPFTASHVGRCRAPLSGTPSTATPSGSGRAAVGHADGRGAVVEVVHDRRDGVHPQVGHDVDAVAVHQVGALGERAAVGAHVAADRPHRPVDVGDERPLGGGERGVAAAAEARRRTGSCGRRGCRRRWPTRRGRASRSRSSGRSSPTSYASVVDPRGLGVRAGRPPVGRAVVAAGEPEVVVDVVLPGRGVEPAVRAEQVDPAGVVVAVRVVDPHLDAAAGDDARRARCAGRTGASRRRRRP